MNVDVASGDTPWLAAWGGANVAIGASSLLVPLYVVQLGGDAAALGVLWFATSLAMVPGAVGVGALLDRTGRHRTLALAALAGITASLAAIPLLDSIVPVVLADAVLWLCVASVTPVLTVLVIGDAPESRWNTHIARLNRFQGYGWAAGLVLGAVWTRVFAGRLSPLGVQRSLLWTCVGLLVLASLAAARFLPAEEARTTPRVMARSRRARVLIRGALAPLAAGRLVALARRPDPRRLVRQARRPLGLYFVAVALFFAGFAVFSAPLPDFLTRTGYGDDAIFALYVVSSLAAAVFFVGAGELADRYDLRRLQSGALGLRVVVFPAVAVVGFGFADSLVGLLAAAVLFGLIGLSWALITVTANSLVARLATPEARGSALGLYIALSAGAGGVGGLLGGWLATVTDYGVTFAVAGALVLLGSLLVLGLDRFAADVAAPAHAD